MSFGQRSVEEVRFEQQIRAARARQREITGAVARRAPKLECMWAEAIGPEAYLLRIDEGDDLVADFAFTLEDMLSRRASERVSQALESYAARRRGREPSA